eukprot:2391961-Amphidinium_carterae.1
MSQCAPARWTPLCEAVGKVATRSTPDVKEKALSKLVIAALPPISNIGTPQELSEKAQDLIRHALEPYAQWDEEQGEQEEVSAGCSKVVDTCEYMLKHATLKDEMVLSSRTSVDEMEASRKFSNRYAPCRARSEEHGDASTACELLERATVKHF